MKKRLEARSPLTALRSAFAAETIYAPIITASPRFVKRGKQIRIITNFYALYKLFQALFRINRPLTTECLFVILYTNEFQEKMMQCKFTAKRGSTTIVGDIFLPEKLPAPAVVFSHGFGGTTNSFYPDRR